MHQFLRNAYQDNQNIKLNPSAPFECSFQEAQDWCNFVVLRPTFFPDNCKLGAVTVRAETADHASSLRMFVEGPSRSFRLKHFFQDWWLPTSCDTNFTGPGRPFVASGIVGFFGRDYKGREAACIHRYGGILEISVINGKFHPHEIRNFLEGLQPQVPQAVDLIAPLQFARVSYYARKGPCRGPWNYDLITGCQWHDDRKALETSDLPTNIYFPKLIPRGYQFDSAGIRQEPASRHWEYQLLFRHKENLTDNIWIRAVQEKSEKTLWIAPGLDARMGIRLRTVSLEKRTVLAGSVSEPHGERVAQWLENGIAFEVHARATLHLGESEFMNLLDSLSIE
ncbi:MAG: hypothetical protein A3F68_04085 [Acidobacteria bacterium RIFCSPLOWO2_12_FULL_54_10]|nr:MAG: hypothetical protein A3F68_04085 [Acidobacteria bacterium RIFCSPLOWO2_12_FULL_54_10]